MQQAGLNRIANMERAKDKYWAFISYSHADEAVARWLHKALETYRLPKALIGSRPGGVEIPKRLFPVFRDRDELATSESLGSEIEQALDASEALIVIASKSSATSHWVNEEIRSYKARGRGHRVFCLIADGEPFASNRNQPEQECFAPALRFQLHEHGQIGDLPAEPIAADLRPGKDGRQDALLKLIAGVLALPLDELRRRERRRQIRQRLIATAAGIGVISIVAALLMAQQRAYAERQHQERLDRLVQRGMAELQNGQDMRAARFLGAAYVGGRRDDALRLGLGRAMQLVDAVDREWRLPSHAWQIREVIWDGRRVILDSLHRQYAFDTDDGQMLWSRDYAREATGSFVPGHQRYLQVEQVSKLQRLHNYRLFDSNSGELIRDLGPHKSALLGQPVGTAGIALVDEAGIVEIFEPVAGRLVQRLPSAEAIVVAWIDAERIAVGDKHGSIALWQVGAPVPLRQWPAHPVALTGLLVSPDRELLVSSDGNSPARYWSLADGASVDRVGGATPISSWQFDARGHRLMFKDDAGLTLWSAPEGALLMSQPTEERCEWCGSGLSADGERLITPFNGQVTVSDVDTNRRQFSIDGPGPQVRSAEFLDADNRFLTVDGDILRLWQEPPRPFLRLRFDSPLRSLSQLPPLPEAAFSADSSLLAVLSETGLRIARTDKPEVLELPLPQEHPDSAARCLRLAEDGSRVWATYGNTLLSWDTTKLAPPGIETLPDAVDCVRLGAAGKRRAMYAQGGQSLMLSAGAEIQSIDLGFAIGDVQFSNGDDRLIVTGLQGELAFLDAATGMILAVERAHAGPASFVRIALDAQRLRAVSAGGDGWLRVWNTRNGALLAQREVTIPVQPNIASFDAAGSRVVYGAYPSQIGIWDWRSDQIQQWPSGDTRNVSPVFSPDGRWIVSAAKNGNIRLWDARSRQPLLWLGSHGHRTSAQFSPNGLWVLSRGRDQVAKLWRLQSETRPAAELASLLDCRLPWRLEGERLVEAAPNFDSCPESSR